MEVLRPGYQPGLPANSGIQGVVKEDLIKDHGRLEFEQVLWAFQNRATVLYI